MPMNGYQQYGTTTALATFNNDSFKVYESGSRIVHNNNKNNTSHHSQEC